MPELPEVETVRRTLNELVLQKKIDHVTVHLNRIILLPEEPLEFCLLLAGQTIQNVERRGKFLCFMMDDFTLVSHLRMEGRYGLYDQLDPLEPHTHVVFHFTDGSELRYKDVRQFGTMHLFPKGRELEENPLKKLGLEPLDEDFTLAAFSSKLSGRSTKIKPLLLNQEYIVGIGNIYVDESLFLAGIHPERAANTLTRRELASLYEAIVKTLQEAVAAGGSSIKSFVNGQGEIGLFQHQFKMYGRKGEPCYTCGQPIEKSVVAGRGTHFCPKCQPLKWKQKHVKKVRV
ncbi:DNA-formamidopyrimidine glycosylase [Paenibacillus radicis (ex Xue et al. 2023)]|uniref:Formamidopyrimidine-DNA glycosylase n=1 Tax=Paenibacillus radicis (ex Xue et al. 2023) TaxID=2972489 RepID=A0ABT1YDD7_9BACL|nr:DNA-formamidopyrimidine glycosylase [Paenibacillus radicis (ex Xue et al. 2023)]MCR8630942.1 DNA-formamidopyrimidine glycosylase [Paenibacillus radicis (ex Xue et al. 2023)]